MICSSCGKSISDNVKFCPLCGTPVAQGTTGNTLPLSETKELELAHNYVHGIGIEQSYEKAAEIYKRLADDGSSKGAYNYAILLKSGKLTGIPDHGGAMAYFRKAADAGNSDAMYWLGEYFESGSFVNKDPDQAMYWFRKSASMGNSKAAALLNPTAESPSRQDRTVQSSEPFDGNIRLTGNRDYLLNLLNQAKPVIDQAWQLEKKARSLRYYFHPYYTLSVWMLLSIVITFAGCLHHGRVPAGSIVGVIVLLVVALALSVFGYLQSSKLLKESDEICRSNYQAIQFLQPKYWSTPCIDYLIDIVSYMRAVTFNDALRMLDSKMHQDHMEAIARARN